MPTKQEIDDLYGIESGSVLGPSVSAIQSEVGGESQVEPGEDYDTVDDTIQNFTNILGLNRNTTKQDSVYSTAGTELSTVTSTMSCSTDVYVDRLYGKQGSFKMQGSFKNSL